MKAVILGDSHRDYRSIHKILTFEEPFQQIIHTGDVHRDVEDILAVYPDIPCAYVLGNNDFSVLGVPWRREFLLGNTKIFLTHGHLYGVKLSYGRLLREAKACGAKICIFGHTHRAVAEERDGIFLLNPGAAYRSYAVLEYDGGDFGITLKETPE